MIELENIGVTFRGGDSAALTDVSLSVGTGEFAFFVGPTGAGKSSLLRLLYGDLEATSGRVRVAGVDLTPIDRRSLPTLRRRMGIVLQDYGLLPQRTIWENVAFACQVLDVPRHELRERVKTALSRVGMLSRCDALPSELSGGEQQRVAIARALVNDPPLVLADEPTGNLDPATSAGIMDLFVDANERGATVVIATHDAVAVDRLRRRVIAIDKGRMVRDDSRGVYFGASG